MTSDVPSVQVTLDNLRPLHDRVLVRRDTAEDKTSWGLIIPDTAKERPNKGVVIAVGDGQVLEDGTKRKLDVEQGDKVLFSKYMGSELKIGEDKYVLLKEDDILGVVTDDKGDAAS